MTCIQIRQTGQLSFSVCTLRHSEDSTKSSKLRNGQNPIKVWKLLPKQCPKINQRLYFAKSALYIRQLHHLKC